MKVLHHFQSPDQLSILGIANSTVTTLQHALTLIPVKVVALLPDFLLLPIPASGQTILANINGHLLAREGEFSGQSIDDLAVYLDYQPAHMSYKVTNLSSAQMQSLEAVVTQDLLENFDYHVPELENPNNILLMFYLRLKIIRAYLVIGKLVWRSFWVCW